MKLLRRLRFSIASMLLAVLLLGSSVLVWQKWPAWKMVKTWEKGEVKHSVYPFGYSEATLQHYFDRLTGFEKGDPDALLPPVKPKVNRDQYTYALDSIGEQVLMNSPINVTLYHRDQPNAVWSIPYSKYGKIRMGGFCYPRNSGYIFLEVSISDTQKKILIVDSKTGTLLKTFPADTCHLLYVVLVGKRWLGLLGDRSDAYVWDLEQNKRVAAPDNFAVLGTTAGKEVYMSPSYDEGSTIDIFAQLNHSTSYYRWDLANGNGEGWKSGRIIKTNSTQLSVHESNSYQYFLRRTGAADIKLETASSGYSYFAISPDQKRILGTWSDFPDSLENSDRKAECVWDAETGELLAQLPREHSYSLFSADSRGILSSNPFNDSFSYWRQQHSERWYGILETLEFWITLVLFFALVLSLRCDYKTLSR